jgi:hypothetical protein
MPPCRSCSGARRGSLTNLKWCHDAEHPRKEEAPTQRGPEFPIFGKGDRHGCLGASVRLERRCVLPLSQIRHVQSQGLRRKRQGLCRFGYLAHDRLCGGPQPVPHVQRRHGRNLHLQSQGPHPTDDQRGLGVGRRHHLELEGGLRQSRAEEDQPAPGIWPNTTPGSTNTDRCPAT